MVFKMLKRETFVSAIGKIKQHEAIMDKMRAILREFGDFAPSLDFGSLHLEALLAVLKDAMNDEGDYISWWLYEDLDHTITWTQGDYECSRDLNDVNALYDYLIETQGDRAAPHDDADQ